MQKIHPLPPETQKPCYNCYIWSKLWLVEHVCVWLFKKKILWNKLDKIVYKKP